LVGCECVPEDVVEDVELRKHTIIGAKVLLIPGIVERSQLIIQYSPLGADWLSSKIISGKRKVGGKLRDLQLISVTFKCEVEIGVQSFTTPPSSGIKLSQ
jgi:hypothetical protein